MDSIGSYQGIFNQSSITTDASELIITGLIDNKVIGSIGGILTNNVSTDGLDEGKTNQYYTDTRARNALSAGSGISYNSSTGQITNQGIITVQGTTDQVIVETTSQGSITLSLPQSIALFSQPTFARLTNSAIGSYSQIYGTSAGQNYTGNYSTLIGHQVVFNTSSASGLVGVGFRALYNCTGSYNTAIGSTAGYEITSGTYNVMIGNNAGRGTYALTTGSSNIYIGSNSASSSNNVSREIVIGEGEGVGNNTAKIYASNGLYVSNLTDGLLKSTSGKIMNAISSDYIASITGTTNQINVNNVSGAITLSTPQDIGTSSSPRFARLANSSVGSSNVLLGDSSGSSITTGAYNVAIGTQALGSCISGQSNMTIGYQSLYNCTGNNNMALGFTAGYALTTGSNNIFIGNSSGRGTYGLTTGQYSIYLGSGSSPSATNATREIVLGDTTGNGSNTATIRADLGLYVSNLTSGVLKSSTAGLITSTATTDDLTEGKTNQYFTTARARGAFTAGTGISIASGVITNTAPALITSITGTTNQINVSGTGAITLSTPQDIGTSSSVQFARILDSSINTSNTIIGTSAGARLTTGGGNILIGQSAGNNVTSGTFNMFIGLGAGGGSGTLNTLNAQNIAIGTNSMFSSTLTAARNISIGVNSFISLTTGVGNIGLGDGQNQILTTGSNNVYIGRNVSASAIGVNNETVISADSALATGRGTGTCFINSPNGLFSYSPAYCQLRSTAFNNGIVTWQFLNDGTTLYNNGFQLLSSNTLVVQPYAGLYEITVSGSAMGQAGLYVALDLYVNNVRGFYNIAYQSSSGINGYIVNVSGTQLSRPYVSSTPSLTGWQVNCNGGRFYSIDFPLFMTIKFISL